MRRKNRRKPAKNLNRICTVRECLDHDWPPATRRRLVGLLTLSGGLRRTRKEREWTIH